MTVPALSFRNVSKIYPTAGDQQLKALDGISFDLKQGDRISIVGRSGSGKSTMLHLAAGVDIPTTGSVLVEGSDMSSMSERQRTLLRRDRIGLVFQFFYLLPHLSVMDNIALPEWIAGSPGSVFRGRATHLLERVGLIQRAEDTIDKLSGGEMQRVSICRALLRKPRLLLADEPTGSLDDENAFAVIHLMLEMSREEGTTLVYVTHSRELARLADAIWTIHSGVLETGQKT